MELGDSQQENIEWEPLERGWWVEYTKT